VYGDLSPRSISPALPPIWYYLNASEMSTTSACDSVRYPQRWVFSIYNRFIHLSVCAKRCVRSRALALSLPHYLARAL